MTEPLNINDFIRPGRPAGEQVRPFTPEIQHALYARLSGDGGVSKLEAIIEASTETGRKPMFNKAKRMYAAGHPPGVIATYTGLTPVEVRLLLGV